MAKRVSRSFEPCDSGNGRSNVPVVGSSGFSKVAKDVMNRQHNRNHLDSNWRVPEARALIAHDLQKLSIHEGDAGIRRSKVGSVQSHTDKGRTDTKARDYKLGDIVRVPHVVPSLNPSSTIGESFVGFVSDTGPVVGKLRPAVVVAIYEHTMICLPIYTSGGRGPSLADSNNCVLIRDWQDDSRAWNNCREYEYVIFAPSYEAPNNGYINLTKAYPVEYRYPIVRQSKLTEQSCQRLTEMWMISIQKGQQPISAQEDWAKAQARKLPVTNEFRAVRKAELERKEAEKEKDRQRRAAEKTSRRVSRRY